MTSEAAKSPGSTPIDIQVAAIETKKAQESPNGNGDGGSPKKSPESNNPLMIQGGRSLLFYNIDEAKARADRMMHAHSEDKRPLSRITSQAEDADDANHLGVRPPLNRDGTFVSELSDERSSASEYDDAHETNEGEMKCKKYGNTSFSARKTKEGTCLVCSKCGSRA